MKLSNQETHTKLYSNDPYFGACISRFFLTAFLVSLRDLDVLNIAARIAHKHKFLTEFRVYSCKAGVVILTEQLAKVANRADLCVQDKVIKLSRTSSKKGLVKN